MSPLELAELRCDGAITLRDLADAAAELTAQPPRDLHRELAFAQYEVARDERRLAQGQQCAGQLARSRFAVTQLTAAIEAAQAQKMQVAA